MWDKIKKLKYELQARTSEGEQRHRNDNTNGQLLNRHADRPYVFYFFPTAHFLKTILSHPARGTFYFAHPHQAHRTRQMTPLDFKNKFNAKRLENTTDHITPRDPNFTKYDEVFQNKFVNNIGNLVLMVWGDNSEKKNNNPINKIHLF
ncbi:MAG: DUF1524 domain-containing protein [Sphingobacteriales bacterium]|nr:DUF1524 domain-containing protein [Sphingobacteriales bacterium]